MIEFNLKLRLSLHIEDLQLQLRIFNPKRQAVRIAILDEQKKEIHMDTISKGNKRVLTARAVTDNGSPAKFKAGDVPVWTVSPEGGVLLAPSSDGLTCDVGWAAAGSQTITCTGKNAAGADIVGTVDIVTLPEVPTEPLATRIQIDVGPEEAL